MRHVLALSMIGSATVAAAPLGNTAPKTAADRFELTWVVHPPHEHDQYSRRPLDLEVRIGGVSRKIELALQLGSLFPYNQVVCKTQAYPLERNEVAKITFYEGGAGGYFVRRTKPGAFELVDWSQTDGACPDAKGEPAACPRHEKFVSKLDAPPDAKVVEAIVEIDDDGKRHPFSCKR